MDASLLIVSFNTQDRLRQCLKSLETGRGAATIQIVVVDNDSRDGSAAMVTAEFPDAVLIQSPSNLGFANACNKALSVATGRYIILLNPDAIVPSAAIESAISLMDAHADVGMGGGRLIDEQGNDQPSARMFPTLVLEFFNLSGLAGRFPRSRIFGRFDRTWAPVDEPAEVDWVPGAFAILRSDLIGRIGLFDSRFFLYYEEVDLCRRIRQSGFKVMYWPQVCITHVGGESSRTLTDMSFSSSGSQLTLWRMRSQLLYYRKWHGPLAAWGIKSLEQGWHWLRHKRNRLRSPKKAEESQRMVSLWDHAWDDTQGGVTSPQQPW